MNHADYVYLLEGEPGLRERLGLPIRGTAGTWAELGSGTGVFTQALADLLGPGARIYSIDRDREALLSQELTMRRSFPGTRVNYIAADFTRPLDLPTLDGLLMANSLHFIPDRDKAALLKRLRVLFKPGGEFVIVEYNIDRGNGWVPHPLSFSTWAKLAADCGYTKTNRLGTKPSRFLGEMYAGVAV